MWFLRSRSGLYSPLHHSALCIKIIVHLWYVVLDTTKYEQDFIFLPFNHFQLIFSFFLYLFIYFSSCTDSSSHVCIEDSYISTGDDLIAVKSGWDEYGIAYGRPSHSITIRRVTGSSPFSGIAVGSETSGGVEDVLAEHINLFNMGVGIHLKTNVGRGGVIRNIRVSNVYMENVRKGIKISGDVGDHPDNNFNLNALPVLKDVKIKDVWGENVQQPGLIHGLKNAPFSGICLSNIHLRGSPGPRNLPWQCSDVTGAAIQVSPWPCSELTSRPQHSECSSYF